MVSPPPAKVNARADAIAAAKARVPPAKASYSKTPTGPFQTMVPALPRISTSMPAERGPMSRIMSSSATSATSLHTATAVGENSLAQTTSTGIGTEAPRTRAASMILAASATRSGSTSDFPMGNPAAAMKVLAMPPPTTS